MLSGTSQAFQSTAAHVHVPHFYVIGSCLIISGVTAPRGRGTGRNKRRQSSIVAMKEWPLANKRRMVQQTEEDKSSVLMSLVKY